MIVAVLVFVACSGVSWAMSRPWGAATDEGSNYVKALGVSGGSPLGRPGRFAHVSDNPLQERSVQDATRRFSVPSDLAPKGSSFPCFGLQPEQPATCLGRQSGRPVELTYQGVYPPLPYVLPGVAARVVGSGPVSGLLAARVAQGLSILALLTLALWALGAASAPSLSLLGVVVAVTPTVIGFGWSVQSTGFELAASIAFVALWLRVARDGPASAAVLRWTAVAALVLGASRPLSFGWVVFGLLAVALVRGPRHVLARVRSGGRSAWVALAAVPAAVALGVGWNLVAGARGQPLVAGSGDLVRPTLSALHGGLLNEQIAAFGWGDPALPSWLYDGWRGVLAVLAVLGLWVASWRERAMLLIVGVLYTAVGVAFALESAAAGFSTAGRYFQPAFVVFPLLLGELVWLRRERLSQRITGALVPAVLVVVAIAQLAVLVLNGRRYAVGYSGDRWFFLHDGGWEPPLGWLPWIGLSALGSAALIGLAAAEVVSQRPGSPSRASSSASPDGLPTS